jgi:ATP-dependent DNA helicase RecG
VLGSRQSGLADFALASLVADGDVLGLAREAADQVMKMAGGLAGFPLLRSELDDRYRRLLGSSMLT